MAVLYHDGTEVALGDQVRLRVLFRKHTGRVVYVPGISSMNAEFEYNGMQWVGIRLDDGGLVATPILQKTARLKKKITFVARDTSPYAAPRDREFELDS